MRVCAAVSLSFLFSAAGFAADLNIRVLDPQFAAVSGAQIALVCGSGSKNVVAVRTTSAEGSVLAYSCAAARDLHPLPSLRPAAKTRVPRF